MSSRRRAIRRETALRVVQPLEHAPCTEARLQAMVMNRLQLLRLLGWPVHGWRSNSGAMRNQSGRLVRFGEPGQPDVMACVAGFFIAIELKSGMKSAKARTRTSQAEWRARFERAGGVYVEAPTLHHALAPVLVALDRGMEARP